MSCGSPADAALRLCKDAADGRAWRWLKRRLKTLRRACNEARDDDVFDKWVQRHDTTSRNSLRRTIRAHREDMQPQIVQLAQCLCEDHGFERRSQRVVKQLRACELTRQIAQGFGRRLFDVVHCFVKSLPAWRDDDSALHRLRIVGKRLRYASELVTEIWPDVKLAELNEHLHSLQDRLGAIHDHTVGERRLRKQSLNGSGHLVPMLLQKARNARIRREQQFWLWWDSCPLERMLADTTAEVLRLMRRKS